MCGAEIERKGSATAIAAETAHAAKLRRDSVSVLLISAHPRLAPMSVSNLFFT